MTFFTEELVDAVTTRRYDQCRTSTRATRFAEAIEQIVPKIVDEWFEKLQVIADETSDNHMDPVYEIFEDDDEVDAALEIIIQTAQLRLVEKIIDVHAKVAAEQAYAAF